MGSFFVLTNNDKSAILAVVRSSFSFADLIVLVAIVEFLACLNPDTVQNRLPRTPNRFLIETK